MFTNGDDADYRCNGSAAKKFREATSEERATYRRWLRGIICFYCGLLFASGVAAVTYSGTGRSQPAGLPAHRSAQAD